MDADYANERAPGAHSRTYRTATGELVEGQGSYVVRGVGVWGHKLQMTGEKTHVHKPLLSVGDVTDKGHAVWMDGDAGYIIQRGSPILSEMRALFERTSERYSWDGVLDLKKERGVYNLYVQVEASKENRSNDGGETIDVSPNEMETDHPEAPLQQQGAAPSGGRRQASP